MKGFGRNFNGKNFERAPKRELRRLSFCERLLALLLCAALIAPKALAVDVSAGDESVSVAAEPGEYEDSTDDADLGEDIGEELYEETDGAVTGETGDDGGHIGDFEKPGEHDVRKKRQAPLLPPELTAAVYPEKLDVSVSSGSAETEVEYRIIDQGAGSAELEGALLSASRAGTFIVKATKPGDDHYNPVSRRYAVTIEPKPVSVINTAVRGKVYDGRDTAEFLETPALGGGGIEPIDSESVSLIFGTPRFTDVAAAEGVPVTFGEFALEGPSSQNYTLLQPEPVFASIEKRTLTAAAAGQTISYGQDIPLAVTVTGFADGEDGNTLKDEGYETPSASCDIGKFAASGPYAGAIAPSGGEATANYTFEYAAADLTVTPAEPIKNTHYAVTAPDGAGGWFSADDFVITPINGTPYSNYDLISADGENWSEGLVFAGESAPSDISFYLRDSKTGAVSMLAVEHYKIDRAAPVNLQISYSEPAFSKLLDAVTFGYYKAPVTVTLTAYDATSGVESFNWTFAPEPGSGGAGTIGDAAGVPEDVSYSDDGKTATAVFTLTAFDARQYRGNIVFTATDRAGNESEASNGGEDGVLVIDTLAPRVVVTYGGELRDKIAPGAARESVTKADGSTRFIYAGAVTATVEVTEANFYPNGSPGGQEYDEADISITATRTLDGKTEEYPLSCKRSDWTRGDGDKWTLTFKLAGDGDYVVTAVYKDRSQNEMRWSSNEYNGKSGAGIYASNTLTIDSTPPTLSVTYGTDSQPAPGGIFKTVRTATVRIEDRSFRPYELVPVLTAQNIKGDAAAGFDADAVAARLRSWEAWTQTSLNVWEATVVFGADARYTLELEYGDVAGNAAGNYALEPFTVDLTPPGELKISYSESLLDKVLGAVTFGYYAPEVVVTLTANDDASGVERFDWTYSTTYSRAPGAGGQSKENAADSGSISADAVEYSYSDGGQTATAVFTLSAGEMKQYRGSIAFTATDYAGNTSDAFDGGISRTIVADTRPPQVAVSYAGELKNMIAPGAARESATEAGGSTRFIYSGAITATVEVTEANFYPNGSPGGPKQEYDKADISITVTRTLDGKTTAYPLSYGKSDWARGDGDNSDIWTLTFKLDGDGDYVVTAVYKDRSQNEMLWSSGEYAGKSGAGIYTSNTLTIDSTAPAITVRYEPEASYPNAETYNTDRKAIIKIEDRNFRPYELTPELTAADVSGAAITSFDAEAAAQALGSWENWTETSLNVWETELIFAHDANYGFALSYRDIAGNAAEYTAPSFTVDKSAPYGLGVSYSSPLLERIIETVTFGYYNPSVTITLTADDGVSGVGHFDWTYTREPGVSAVKNAETESARINADGVIYTNEGRTATASFTLTADEARQYRGSIAFTATDRAGNTSPVSGGAGGRIVVADTISPVASISYGGELRDKIDDGAGRSSVGIADNSTRFIYSGAITATVEITDANFYPNGSPRAAGYDEADILITATRTLDGETEPYPLSYKSSGWINGGGDKWTLTFTLSGDGDYIVTAVYSDRSQNAMELRSGEHEGKASPGGSYVSNVMTIDTARPVINVRYEPDASSPNAETYGADRKAVISIEDRSFRPYELAPAVIARDIRGDIVTDAGVGAEASNLRSWESWKETALNVWEAEIIFGGDARYEFALGYGDIAGNEAGTYTAAPFTVDKTPPGALGIAYSEPRLAKILEAVTFGYYNPSVTVTLTAEDQTAGVESFDWSFTPYPEEAPGGPDGVNTLKASESGGGAAEASFTLTADEARQYRGGIVFTATDKAGNASGALDGGTSMIVVADTISPRVKISYAGELRDKVTPERTRDSVSEPDSSTRFVYSGPVTATVEVTDANFYPNSDPGGSEYDGDDISITVTRTLDDETKAYPLSYEKSDWVHGDGDIWTLTFTLDGDGDYAVSAVYRDRSQNEMLWSSGEYAESSGTAEYRSNVMTIDTLPPVISAVWSPAEASPNAGIYKTDRKAVIKIEDRSFRPYEITPALTAKDVQGAAVTAFDAEAMAAKLRSWESWTSSSLNVWEAEIVFETDAEYGFKLDYADMAGNAAEAYSAEPFTVDKTPPAELAVSYSEPLLEKLLDTVTFGYYNPSVTATLTAEDQTSGVESFSWTYAREPEVSAVKNIETETGRMTADGGVSTNDAAYLSGASMSAVTYSNAGKTAAASFTLTADELRQYRGSIAFTATDRAGNTSENFDDAEKNVLVADTISPTRKITYSAPKQILNAADMTTVTEDIEAYLSREDADVIFYYDADATVTLTITEANFYAEDVAAEVNGESFTSIEWTKTGDETDEYAGAVTLSGDGDYTVKLTYTDRSENEMETYESVRITIDTTAPTIAVVYSPAAGIRTLGGTSYYGAAQTAEITITERNFRADDVAAIITARDVTGSDVAQELVRELTESLSRRESWAEDGETHTTVITYSADANYTFDIEYRDLALRESADYVPDSFTVDTTPPVNPSAAFSESLLETVLETVTLGFYNARVTVTVSADDETSGVYRLVYKSKNGEETAEREIPESEIEYSNGGRTAAASFDIPKQDAPGGGQFDGTVEFTAYDRADNGAGETGALRVIVDTIAPNMTVTYSAPARSADGVSYYAGAVAAAIDVTEANFFKEDISVFVRRDEGEAYAVAPDWTEPQENAHTDAHTGAFTITGDGVYTVAVEYTDRSGNKASPYESHPLVIDTRAPVITLDGIANESANNGEIIGFRLTAGDEHFDPSGFKPRLYAVVKNPDGAFETAELPAGELRTAAAGREYVYITENLTEDGIYTLVCEASDMSGNGADEIAVTDSGGDAVSAVMFSVNRDGSTFMLDGALSGLVGAYYVQNVYDDPVITETNADPLISHRAALNGVALRENEDYTVESSGGAGGWYKYVYRVKKELFEAEGEYKLVVSSRDKAENDAYSDIKSAEISCVVDRTAPVLIVSGVSPDGRYRAETQRVTVVPRDDGGKLGSLKATVTSGGADDVRLELSGERLLEELENGGGALTFDIPSGLSQSVRIVCGDCSADRDGKTNLYEGVFGNVTVSTNAAVIFYANKPLLFGTAAAGVAAPSLTALIVKLLKLRRRLV
ncbi:MAG: YDG domain-containing protein [Oscillospiraceae bacterium]|jgi:hypothetical protein|nr:YDG domain-containing protein [Oscillospiraceae bacterium]